MNITIVHYGTIPVRQYGGTERVIWYLGNELAKLGHNITYLVNEGSYSNFATVKFIDNKKHIWEQIPKHTDVVHFQEQPQNVQLAKHPYIVTVHGNGNDDFKYNKNSVFVSKNHAKRYGSNSFVYNGLDWNDYSEPTFKKENYFHFLGKAAWRVKNVKGAINVIKKTKKERIKILGGNRLNFTMGFRLTLSSRAYFCGMVGGDKKNNLLNKSKGLIFPVLWHEPFGLAIIESLFYGCPVFGTPYGSLPEIVTNEVGFLSNKEQELAKAIENVSGFSQKKCNEYARTVFNSKNMAINYLKKYETVINGNCLNKVAPKLKEVQQEKFLNWYK